MLGIPHLTNPTIFDVVNMLSKESDFGEKIKEALSSGKSIHMQELHLVEKTVQVVLTPVFGPAEEFQDPSLKKVMGVTVLLHDITLQESLSQKKEDFTNAVVHELRSPLTAIKAAAEMMVTSDSVETSQHKLATIIDEQSKRLLNDINSLLDAAKMESGHFTVWQAPVNIAPIIQEAISLFQPQADKKHITLSAHIEEALPQSFIDTTRIGEVLNNLISNSLKFTPENGHIVVRVVSQYSPQLPKTATNPGLLISISDDGIGIPQDKQKKLFTKFSQIRSSQTPEPSEGTGLGLYIAKGIVETHGGNMYINSTPGKGTTIFFTVPVAKEEKKVLLNPKLQEVIERYTPKVLN
jgi:signal transduction histidine kinase